MYNAAYTFGNPAFNQPGAPQPPQQQSPPQQQQGQLNPQMMFNQPQQFSTMQQGGFNPGPNLMQGMPVGMMQNPGMPSLPPNGQMPIYPQQFHAGAYGQMMPGGMPPNFAPNTYMMAAGMQGFPMNQPTMNPQQMQMMQRMQAQHAAQQAAQQQQQHQHHHHQHPQQHHQPQQHHPQGQQAQQHHQQVQQSQHHHQQQQAQQSQQHRQQGQKLQPQQKQQQLQQQMHQQQLQQQQLQQQQMQQQQMQQQQLQQQQMQQQHMQQQQLQQQQLQQSLQPQMKSGTNVMGVPQRPPSAARATPTNVMHHQQQPQFNNTPQLQAQTPTPHNPQQTSASGTPQTPTFSANQGAGTSLATSATPMSPGTESCEKERFALLLDINHELLYESIQIQNTQHELKKENTPASGNAAERKPTEEETLFQQDYFQCMRRLQTNLSYMAALADRKPEVKAPPCPAYLSAPPLNLSLKLRAPPVALEGQDQNMDTMADRRERDKSLKDLYARLQAVFPGIDPKKEPVYRLPGPGQKPGLHGPNQASPTVQQNAQMIGMTTPTANPGVVG